MCDNRFKEPYDNSKRANVYHDDKKRNGGDAKHTNTHTHTIHTPHNFHEIREEEKRKREQEEDRRR